MSGPARQVGVAGLPVVALDAGELAAKLGLELVEIEHDGEAGPVADQEEAVAVVDVAARTRDQDAPLGLLALALVVDAGPQQLLVGEAGGERQQQGRHESVEEEDARVARLVRLEQGAGIVLPGRLRRVHGLPSEHSLARGGDEGEGLFLEREEPRGNQREKTSEQIKSATSRGPRRAAAGARRGLQQGEGEKEREIGCQREADPAREMVVRHPFAQRLQQGGGGGEKEDMRAEGHGGAGIADGAGQQGGEEAGRAGQGRTPRRR